MATALYTYGDWDVKAGSEQAFTQAWLDLDAWTKDEYGPRTGTLLRDRENPNHFMSWVAWENFEQIASRRASPAFRGMVDRIMVHVVSHRPSALDVVNEA
jgi:quinol monooxygenase YgiN